MSRECIYPNGYEGSGQATSVRFREKYTNSGMYAWNRLPEAMQTNLVRPYWEILYRKRPYLHLKRLMDIVLSLGVLIVTCPIILVAILLIMIDSPGNPLFMQSRVTRYGRLFTIIKLRTMRTDVESQAVAGSVQNHVTRVGRWLRRLKIDELPQAWNVIKGDMSLVGPRPELPCFVLKYDSEMRATLLVPAGVTSRASIVFRNEESLMRGSSDAKSAYVEYILPAKMKINLAELCKVGILKDINVMIHTAFPFLAIPDSWNLT